jgi:hypothetical protein
MVAIKIRAILEPIALVIPIYLPAPDRNKLTLFARLPSADSKPTPTVNPELKLIGHHRAIDLRWNFFLV